MKTEADELLLTCLRRDGGGPPAERLAGLPPDEWTALLAAAGRHSLTPLLYHTLKPVMADAKVPAVVEAQLRAAYLASAARNMRLYHELGQVLAACNDAGTPVILLKGAYLAKFVYGNIALRPMADMDILVRHADLAAVSDIMAGQDYLTCPDEVCCAEEHLPPFRKDGSLQIEIHFNIAGPPFSDRIDLKGLWERAQPISIDGVDAFTLSPEDLLLHLSIHASIHHVFDNGIGPLLDVARTIEHYNGSIDWKVVAARAEDWGVSRCACVVLSLARNLVGAAVPDHVVGDLGSQDNGSDPFVMAEELMFDESEAISSLNMARLFSDKGVSARLAWFVRCAFPPKTTMATMNPSATGPLSIYLSYFSRINGLLKRHGQTARKLLSNDRATLSAAETANKRNTLKDWLGAGDR